MEIWEVTNPAAGVKKNSAQPSYKLPKGIVSEYSKILAEKMSNIKADVREMEETKEQLDEISYLQDELKNSSVNIVTIEKVKRFMPDGSIMITTYEDGKVTEQVRKKPHMISVPDYSAPPKVDGSPETKLEARQSLDLMELLMM